MAGGVEGQERDFFLVGVRVFGSGFGGMAVVFRVVMGRPIPG